MCAYKAFLSLRNIIVVAIESFTVLYWLVNEVGNVDMMGSSYTVMRYCSVTWFLCFV